MKGRNENDAGVLGILRSSRSALFHRTSGLASCVRNEETPTTRHSKLVTERDAILRGETCQDRVSSGFLREAKAILLEVSSLRLMGSRPVEQGIAWGDSNPPIVRGLYVSMR